MPFTLTPICVETRQKETLIRGRVQTGAYFGPENLVVCSNDGREVISQIQQYEMEYPEGWPVLPEHAKTIIILHIPKLPKGFSPDVVKGIGTIDLGTELFDVSHYLEAPEFWAMQAILHVSSEDIEDSANKFFGLPQALVYDWHDANITALQLAGQCPCIRVPLPDSKYIEMEMSAGVEHQDRIWIGENSTLRRVLLGYYSGHFSLPALRIPEITWLACQTPASASPLLWLTETYIYNNTAPLDFILDLVSRIPGIVKSQIGLMTHTLIENLAVSGLLWTMHHDLGWVNNWEYSQRNPKSRLSILSPADFSFIRGFFPMD
jgi:hypothetical protein